MCAESRPPYDRPPLSKGVLAAAGTDPAFRERGWYAEHDVDLLLGTRARRLDAAAGDWSWTAASNSPTTGS